MGTYGTDLEARRQGYEDERDEIDVLAQPNPPLTNPDFPNPADADYPVHATHQRISVVNRPMPAEGVPSCKIRIDTRTTATDQNGNAHVDLSGLTDSEYDAEFCAPDTSDAEMGPYFPPDPSKKRVWRTGRGRVTVEQGRIVAADPSNLLTLNGNTLHVKLQPAWLQAPLARKRTGPVDMIVIHHTAGNLQGDLPWFLYGNRVSIHYLVAPNGDTYKLVMENNTAAHAGYSHWQGQEGMNASSIGIEMCHVSGEYPDAQINAVLDLLVKLHSAFPGVPADRVIAHSDIGICEPTAPSSCTPASPKRLGRKSTDPGATFPWEHVEKLGLSLQIRQGSVSTAMFGEFFRLRPSGSLRRGDNDGAHRYGGEILRQVSGAISELQRNLTNIGYLCGTADGDFGLVTEMALKMFKQHMFSGSRQTNTGDDARLDLVAAVMLKRVLGEVSTVPTS